MPTDAPASMNVRRVLRLCGLAVSLIAVVWIGVRVARSGALDLLVATNVTPLRVAAALLAGAACYTLATCLLALAWWRMMIALSAQPVPARPIMATYAVSQYGKYLPGNVAHYAVRHAWSRRYGFRHAELGLASILEAALLLLAALSLTLLADTHRLRVLSILDPRLAIALLVLMLIVLGIALHFARSKDLVARFHVPALPSMSVLAFCFACYLVFLTLCAVLLDGLAHVLGISIDSFAMLLCASAASWLAGFVVIGAPGGLGVREAAFVALAGGALGESHALLLIGFFRVVTFLGDTLFFAAGAIFLRVRERRTVADETTPTSENRRSP
jgi:hypothetical protein